MLHVVVRRIAMSKKFWKLVLAAAMLIAPAACKDDHARSADRAADKVKKAVDEIADKQKDIAKEQQKADEKQSDVAKAQTDFEKQKALRINDLDMTYNTIA